MYGAVVRQATSVTGLSQTGTGGWIVDTADGQRLTAARVVNAAGLWAREVGKLSALDLPLVPVHHQVCVCRVAQTGARKMQDMKMKCLAC